MILRSVSSNKSAPSPIPLLLFSHCLTPVKTSSGASEFVKVSEASGS